MRRIASALLLCTALVAGEPSSPEAAIRGIYRSISFAPGGLPDFQGLEGLFLPQACLELRVGGAFRTQSPAQFVADYRTNLAQGGHRAKGFEERILGLEVQAWGDAASARVAYEARIPGMPEPLRRGLDHISLVRKEDRWWIAAVVSEVERPDRPLPQLPADR